MCLSQVAHELVQTLLSGPTEPGLAPFRKDAPIVGLRMAASGAVEPMHVQACTRPRLKLRGRS